MDNILSGGKVDPSTSGPTPPNTDDRDRDILLEQKEKQDQDAIGGTQFPPKPLPLPPIPEAPEVAPPLPVIPSFDFNISGSALEGFREISRQATMDILKNVNINGQGPSFEGSTISFNIPQQPPASEAFIFQGIMVPQPPPQIQPIQPPVLPPAQTEQEQEAQSLVVAPPKSTNQEEVKNYSEQLPANQPATEVSPELETTQLPSIKFIEQAQPPTDALKSDAPQEPLVKNELRSTEPFEDEAFFKNSIDNQKTTRENIFSGTIESILEKIPENEPITIRTIRMAAGEAGFQTTQRAFDNYIDPQKIKDAIEEKEKKEEVAEKFVQSLNLPDSADLDEVKDYVAGNTPFPPLVSFQVCVNDELKTFLIPAFGPY